MKRHLDIARLRLKSLFRRGRVESDLDRELSFHLDQLAQENVARGMSPEEARTAAKRRLGGPAQVQEECRDMRRTNLLETIWNDLRYAIRSLGKTPGFTIVIVLTMALAIGANSAIFSVIEGVLLRPLSYPQADRLVRVYFNSDNFAKFPLNPNDFLDFRSRNRTFESMAVITRSDQQLSRAGGEPIRLKSFRVSSGYFGMLGLAPARGRDFSRDDELPNRGHIAILSDNLWRSRFNADLSILGRSITLNAEPFEVVGVMAPGALHPGNDFHAVADGDTVDLWTPYTFDDDPNERYSHFMDGIGRLKPGVSAEQAKSDLSAVLTQLISEHPGQRGWRILVTPLYVEMVGRAQRMLWVLLGAVGLLLLIACVNAANLLLARSSARVREFAVRTALGAGRTRIIRQLLTESLVIALTGATLGTLLSIGGVRVLVALLPAGFPRASEIHLDANVFAFTLLIAVGAGLLFGIVPSLSASRGDVQQSLREGGRNATSGSGQLRLRNFLVIGETGLACVLLIAGGLMLHSFVNLLRADPGFIPQHVVTAAISLPGEHYRTNPQRMQFFERLLTSLQSLPGVQAAAAGSDIPWTGYDGNASFSIEGRSPEYNRKIAARVHTATPDYFRSLSIPLLAGRFFTAQDDRLDAPAVLIVNEGLAKRFWPGENAVGKRVTFRGKPQEKDWIPVVGIVADIKDQPDSAAARPAFWLTYSQNTERGLIVTVRFNSDPTLLTNQIRLAVRQIDPDLAVSDVRLMDEIADAALSNQRLALYLVGLFALIALALATIGIYGVISYSVNQRMHEFGMRMALGARPSDLMRLILSQGLRLALLGAAIGLLGASVLARVLGSLLYEVKASDPITFASVALLALATTMLACYVPARRASGADPMRSLRSE